jgi:uncharacterized YigZ family protein
MTERRRVIASVGKAEIVTERSRFLGYALGAQTPEEAEAALQAVRAEHPDATHHCYAWRCGPGQERQSDDGEPQATAGLPLLESLRRHGVDFGILVVVRYYGGKKLGRPGLYRAYLGAGSQALAQAQIAELVPGERYRIAAAQKERVALLRAIEAAQGEVLSLGYDAQVRIEFWLPQDALPELVRRCDAAGRAEWACSEVRPRSAQQE